MRVHRKVVVASFAVGMVSAGLVVVPRLASRPPAPSAPPHTPLVADYAKVPISFEPNLGQADPEAAFVARTGAGSLALTPTGSILAGPQGTLRQHFVGANPNPTMAGVEALPGKVNYLRGDPSTWRTNVDTFAKVHYRDVYPGIDVAYYGNAGELEYDFIVTPGADPSVIALAAEGATGAHLDNNGDLVMAVGDAEVRHRRPVAYQEFAGTRHPVKADYRLGHDGRATFSLGAYDTTRALVIDPLVYSTFVGGSSSDSASGLAMDDSGSAYIVGPTISTDFPTAGTPVQATKSGQSDTFVTKLNPSGSAFEYSTYLGGSRIDSPRGVAVDGSGNAYVVGTTRSSDFPGATVFPAAPPLNFDDEHVFLAKLNPTGSALAYSKFLGGNVAEQANDIAIDGSGNAYITGRTLSRDFPVVGGFQSQSGGGWDAFVAKVNVAGTALVYSSYLGGAAEENHPPAAGYVGAIAVDAVGSAFVVGGTQSHDFPVAGTPLQPTQPGAQSAFVTKVNPAGSGLVYSTHLGGTTFAAADAVALDSLGNAFVAGHTDSVDFPTAGPPFQASHRGNYDVFVTKLNPSGSGLIYSTYLGGAGSDGETAVAIAVDGTGVARVAGGTTSSDFPTVNPIQPFKKTETDAFVSHVSADGSALLFSTYLGGNGVINGTEEARGIAVDAAGNSVIVGLATSDFPTAGSPAQGTPGDIVDAFLAKLSPGGAGLGQAPADFDGNGSTDISVFRPSTGAWFVNGGLSVGWGGPGDIAVPADYDGDKSTNIAVFRPSNGVWYLKDIGEVAWGTEGDIAVPADYDGDGFADMAVFRPSTGTWFVRDGVTLNWGTEGDIPVPGDYDGDAKTDIAVFRPSTGTWYVQTSGAGPDIDLAWGTEGDIPVPGDYDGDGTTDLAVFRPSTGVWYVNGGANTAWGTNGDIPVPGDYDGDATTDLAVFRPDNGVWFVNGGETTPWGTDGDFPLPLPAAIQQSLP